MLVFAVDVALMRTPFLGSFEGAVYRPDWVIVPPPAVTPQVTVAGDNPVSVAVYCCVPPSGTFMYPGDIEIVWAYKQPPARIVTLNRVPIRLADLVICSSLRWA
jgi:hypothetical protein